MSAIRRLIANTGVQAVVIVIVKGLRKQTDLNSLQDTDNHVIVVKVVFKAFSDV